MDCLALWKVLRASGTPPFLVQLLEDRHQGTKSRVRADGQLSEPFDTTSGVRYYHLIQCSISASIILYCHGLDS